MLQTGGAAFFQRLIEQEPTLVIDIVVEINVGTDHLVVLQEPTGLAEAVAVGGRVDQDSAHGERRLQ